MSPTSGSNSGWTGPSTSSTEPFCEGRSIGDLGRSLRTGQRVTAAIAERMPATVELAMAAMLFAIVVAVPLGIVAAVRSGTAIDHGATTLALIGISLPGFWLGPVLAIVFADRARMAAGLGARHTPLISFCPRSRSGRRWRRCSRA